MPSESERLIPGIRKDIVLDPSSEIPGFIASELEQRELLQDNTYTDLECTNSVADGEPVSWTRTNVVVGSMSLSIFLAAVDSTIITTLIGDMSAEFDSLDKLSWIASSYLLSSATFQPLYGKISDIFGRRALLLLANVLFLVGCLVCALAPNVLALILGRFISGVGGGGLTTMTSITTSDLIPLKSRGIYQGINNLAFASGSGVGSLVGGYFVSNRILGGWRGAFLMQVPITVLSTVSIHMLLKLPKGSPGLGVHGVDVMNKLRLIDWYGSFTLVITLLSFLTLTSLETDKILAVKGASLLLVFITFLVLFIIAEKRAKFPILPLEFLRIRTVLGASLSNFFFCMSSFNSYFIITIYYTAVMNLTPQQVGYRFAPNFFSIVLGSLGAGYYMRSTGKYYKLLLLSGLLAVFGTWRIVTITPDYPVWAQFFLLITPGFGISVIITATLLALIAAVPHEHQAATTSISYLFRSCGSTLGVSFGSAIFQHRLYSSLHHNVMQFLGHGHDEQELLAIIAKASHSSEYVHGDAPSFITGALVQSYDTSCKLSFQFCLLSCVAGLLSMLLIKEYVLHGTLDRK